jgi:hypothetical protein
VSRHLEKFDFLLFFLCIQYMRFARRCEREGVKASRDIFKRGTQFTRFTGTKSTNTDAEGALTGRKDAAANKWELYADAAQREYLYNKEVLPPRNICIIYMYICMLYAYYICILYIYIIYFMLYIYYTCINFYY